MKIFHVYNEKYMKGLEKNGFINKNSGFKIQHCWTMPDHEKFNQVAAKGGKLHHMIKENNFPFYVDRLVGGLHYQHYTLDKNLIDEYSNLLGNWFLGFQFHEFASNLRIADWGSLIRTMGHKGPYTAEELREKFPARCDLSKAGMFIQGDAEDFASRVYPEDVRSFIEEIHMFMDKRMKEVNGHLLPCDSFFMLTKYQNDIGMKSFMPEVGWQIPLMRIVVALARGIAENSHKSWGVYYEPWRYTRGVGSSGMTSPSFNNGMTKDMLNEWYLTFELHGDDMESYGENGGSSRLLQRRIYFYSLMAGAQYIAEEWGLNNCFYDTEDFTLSPYGQVKKEFIDYAAEMGEVKSIRPFAIVLPLDYSCVEIPMSDATIAIGEHDEEYIWCKLNPEESVRFGKVEDVLKLIFARHDAIYGNEGHTMTNSRFGDMFDIIYADASQEVLDRYDYLIDADPNSNFAKSDNAKGHHVLTSEDLMQLESEIRAASVELMPCVVDQLHWLVSFDSKGKRYLSIFNNEGNERTLFNGDTIIKSADRTVNITFKEDVDITVNKASCDKADLERVDGRNYRVTVPAAGFVIFEF